MFTHTCSHCRRTQLISVTQLTAVSEHEVVFTCWCGSAERAPIGDVFGIAPAAEPVA